MPRHRSPRHAATVLALALGFGALAVAGLATELPAEAATPTPELVEPAEGAIVSPGSVTLRWSDVAAPEGFEVRWAAGGVVDGGGVITGGESAIAAATSLTILAEDAASYAWQVRVLPNGAWSEFRTFDVDLELPTLAQPDAAAGSVDGRGVAAPAGIPGVVWISGAVGFSVALLVIVVVQARLQRARDA